jgi:hypothetical protein
MTTRDESRNPEPVPAASQFAVLPFLAAVEGLLRAADSDAALRITVHRVMNREGQEYLQQVCRYVGPEKPEHQTGTGRMFPTNFGLMGKALGAMKVMRTHWFETESQARSALAADMKATDDLRDPATQPLSYLAIPFLGPDDEPVLVLYADSHSLNFFADPSRTKTLVDMCWGYCRFVDSLQQVPFPDLRNFPFEPGEPVTGDDTAYPSLHEKVDDVDVPRFAHLRSFNFEASVL